MTQRVRKGVAGIVIALSAAVGVAAYESQASATVPTVDWPGVPLPYAVTYAHGDGSLSVAPDDCANTNADTTTAMATISPDRSQTYSLVKNTAGWRASGCAFQRTVGTDSTVYVVQQRVASPTIERIAAVRDGTVIWTSSGTAGACGSPFYIYNLAMGFDGDLYAVVVSATGCAQLQGFNIATGAVDTTMPPLPNAGGHMTGTNIVLPYRFGVAVLDGGPHAYFYGYDGVADGSQTFSPTVATGTQFLSAAISADGRLFMSTQRYLPATNSYESHLFYKDASSDVVDEIALPTGVSLSNSLATTPTDGVVAIWVQSSHIHIGSFDNIGALAYDKDLSVDPSGTLSSSSNPKVGYAVDSDGNVLVERVMTSTTAPYDQNVDVDSFDPAGSVTRLFDSNAEFGTTGVDVFTGAAMISQQSLGDGVAYIVLCHRVYTGGSYPTTCTSADTPQIVTVPTPGQFAYPRSEFVNATNQYVALGDSYASGEGNPPFLPGTDNDGGDGCDRGFDSYPRLLQTAGLDLRAFVACSGATSGGVNAGWDGEPSQLYSLNSHTTIVTVTVGGDDAKFGSFAKECVVGTCDAGSSQYQDTMDVIDNTLTGNLALLYTRIRAAAPNATVYVVGYPLVAPPSGTSCAFLSDGEKIAANTVVTGLNNKINAAVNVAGPGFVFVDPTAAGSPFAGHELCSSDSYFFGVNVLEHRFSFHPNAEGQLAYFELIISALGN